MISWLLVIILTITKIVCNFYGENKMVNRDFRINYNLNSEILHNLYYIIQNSAKKYLDYENLNGLL